MQMQGKANRVTIYIGEEDHYQGQALHIVLLQFLKRQGALGATVTRGLAGFGAHSRTHTATIVTQPVMTVQAGYSVRLAVSRMVERELKRLPVVDQEERLAGLLGRASLLYELISERANEA